MANKPPTPFQQGNVWYFKMQVDGVRKSFPMPEARTKREAEAAVRRVWEEQKAKSTLLRLAQGNVVGKAKDMSFTMACGTWFQDYGLKLKGSRTVKGRKELKRRLDLMVEIVGADLMMTKLDTSVVKDFKRSLENTISEKTGRPLAMTTIRNMLGELKRIVYWTLDEEIAVPHIAWKKVAVKESECNERDRVLSFEEIEIIRAHIRPDYLPVFDFAVASAFRLENLTGLKWSSVDFQRRVITVTVKGRKPHVTDITPDVEAILRAQEPFKDGRDSAVFTYECARSFRMNATSGRREIKGRRYAITYSGFSSYWTRFGKRLEDLGVPHVTPHDLRRTSITNFQDAVGDITLTAKHAGHSDSRLTAKVYRKIAERTQRAASDVAAAYRTNQAELARAAAASSASVHG